MAATVTDRRPSFGDCPACRERHLLRDDGTLVAHLVPLGRTARWGRETCPGTGRRPEVER